MNGA
jgi:hypothetical protein